MPKTSSKANTKRATHGPAGQSPGTASSSDTNAPTAFWTDEKDRVLVASRSSGVHWDAIATKHFPSKTGNACRKRYERLMLKKKASEWIGPRFDALAIEYVARRKEMWLPLANSLGENWQVIEAKVFERGLKAVLSVQGAASIRQADEAEEDSGLGPDLHSGGIDDEENLHDDINFGQGPPLQNAGRMRSTYDPGLMGPRSLPSLSTALPAPPVGWHPAESRMHQHPAMHSSYGPSPPVYNGPPIPPIQAPSWTPDGSQEYSYYSNPTFDPSLPYGNYRPF